jgi:hypothetical protein
LAGIWRFRRGRCEIICRMLIIVQSLPIEAFSKRLRARFVMIMMFIALLATLANPLRPAVYSTDISGYESYLHSPS